MYDIIPDIHGQSEKLHGLLAHLGWTQTAAGWRNDVPERQIVFLGDFIDRGPDNAGVIATVRSLMDSGKAQAVMGNHELNAIHYHTADPARKGTYLRKRSTKNHDQHSTFLKDFPPEAPQTREAIAWMRSLPLFLETDSFRAVHACWDEASIGALKQVTEDGVLSEEQVISAVDEADPLYGPVDRTAKGPEVRLPTGYSFRDKNGIERDEVRIRWWQGGSASWANLAMSVPDPSELPVTAPPPSVTSLAYPTDAKPVFFGHYWLEGTPRLQAPNALCLDYSAGLDGPLVAYRLEEVGAPIDLQQIVTADPARL